MPVAGEKTCATCGRRITWRKKWADSWDEVKYCSQRCRIRRPTSVDADLERSILDLLAQRKHDATICPSEAARAVGGDAWRDLMEPSRQAARRLVAQGRIEIVQRGKVVDPSTARGPIRLRSTDDPGNPATS
ncbi:DUF2256 and DUF3253 domain-containing protein [Nakamurella sp. A5-74]|uniref:DUF2256 and DUF3253 domain-containing protein n=1 Tax=Nakamurella sp. A5-74 TaxID=3158264 RepID=A0AAU8DTV3_9ACTN